MSPRRAFSVWRRLVAASVRSQLQYRASFLMLSLGHFLLTGIEFLGIALLFERFGSIRGFALPEVALLYGMVNVSFALADATSTGFDRFGETLKAGDFDRILLRPLPAPLQLAGAELTLRRVGRLAQGLLVLGFASRSLAIAWTPERILLLGASLLGGALLFYGILVLQATLAFWTVESLEAMNVFTYGGVECLQYPLSIYRPGFRTFFVYGIPLACVNWFPALGILGRQDPLGHGAWMPWISPLVCLGFLILSLAAFERGVRRYASTGS